VCSNTPEFLDCVTTPHRFPMATALTLIIEKPEIPIALLGTSLA
jgi:hypothetical protein